MSTANHSWFIEIKIFWPISRFDSVWSYYRLLECYRTTFQQYLIPDIVEGSGPDTYVWIEKTLTKIFVKLYSKLEQYVCPNGKLVFKLRKYLYGLPQAAFYNVAARFYAIDFGYVTGLLITRLCKFPWHNIYGYIEDVYYED